MTHSEEPSMGDLLHAISRLDEKVDRVVVQTTRTNGRVTLLEEKDIAREKREAVADAVARVNGQTALTKKGLTAILAAVTILFTAAQFAIGVLR